MNELCENPYLGTRMVVTKLYESRVSASRGAYRIIYSINRDERRISFYDIGKHKILG